MSEWVGFIVEGKYNDVYGKVIGVVDISIEEYKEWYKRKYRVEAEGFIMVGVEGKCLLIDDECKGSELELMWEGEISKIDMREMLRRRG